MAIRALSSAREATSAGAGDTPLDVAVAVAGGTRSLGVATGSYREDALLESGADRVLADLRHLDIVIDALGLPR